MSKKIRIIIISVLTVLFLIFSPLLILYSQGYRLNLEKKELIETGGLSLKISPPETEIYLNDKLIKKTDAFLGTAFLQNLLPKEYKVTVKKEKYLPWEKILQIREKEVAKAENIILFPEKIQLTLNEEEIENAFPSEQKLPKEAKKILKDLKTFRIFRNNIFWLSTEGLLIKSDLHGKMLEVLNKKPFQIKKDAEYTLKISPDLKKIFIFSGHEIWLSDLKDKITFLNRFSENIGDCFWLNPNYLIFDMENKIKIMEIDNRDKLNLYNLNIELPDEHLGLEKQHPVLEKIFFDISNKKLYLQTKESLYSSEPLL